MTSIFSSNETTTLERDVEKTGEVPLEQIWTPEELTRCSDFISKNKFQRVCLQFPDELISHSIEITSQISKAVQAKVFILGDTSYGSCCVDEVAAAHANADAIIHFGHACLSKVTRVPVLYIFLKFPLDVSKFRDDFHKLRTEKLKTEARVILFYDVGYHHVVEKVAEKLPGVQVAKLALEEEPKVLCWTTTDTENAICLFIGKDNQTFFNISMALKAAQWFLYSGDFTEASPMDSRWLRRRYFYIEKCKDARALGIVVGTLTSRGYLDMVAQIQSLAKSRSIRTYLISVGKVNPAKLANFLDIDAFVLVGCPENSLYVSKDFYKPLVSVFEIELALNPAWQSQLPDTYCTDFRELLPQGNLYKEPTGDFEANDVSLVSGRPRNLNKDEQRDSDMAVERVRNELSETFESFNARSFQGLDRNLGRDEPARIQRGRQGIPIKYSENPINEQE